MKISPELAHQIIEFSLQLENKFGIKIGYSHPMGCFLEDDDTFVIIEEGRLVIINEKNNEFDFVDQESFIVEANPHLVETNEFLVTTNFDNHQRSERLNDFLIDFHNWLKTGELKKEEYREYGKYKWKPAGDGRFCVEKHDASSVTSYTRHLDEIDDITIRSHIEKCLYGE
jgi:hypothetical protein